jgi:hypothetical protein
MKSLQTRRRVELSGPRRVSRSHFTTTNTGRAPLCAQLASRRARPLGDSEVPVAMTHASLRTGHGFDCHLPEKTEPRKARITMPARLKRRPAGGLPTEPTWVVATCVQWARQRESRGYSDGVLVGNWPTEPHSGALVSTAAQPALSLPQRLGQVARTGVCVASFVKNGKIDRCRNRAGTGCLPGLRGCERRRLSICESPRCLTSSSKGQHPMARP